MRARYFNAKPNNKKKRDGFLEIFEVVCKFVKGRQTANPKNNKQTVDIAVQ
jgi:hypothetical protein